jgi:PAS domain S-box-containing protein
VGVPSEELLSLTAEEFASMIHPEDRRLMFKRYGSRLEGLDAPPRYGLRVRTAGGETRWIEVYSSLVEFGGEPAVQAAVLDVTQSALADRERRLLDSRLRQAQRLESLEVLAGGIAHDFNNLLMVILGNAEMALRRSPPDAVAIPFLREIESTAHTASGLCQQLLAYAGRFSLEFEPVDVNHAIQKVAQLLESTVGDRGRLRFRLAVGLPPVVADTTQLQQVVLNLVMNAAESLAGGGGPIEVATGSVECDRTALASTVCDDGLDEGTYVFVDVSDEGAGMDEETQQKIFNPFFTTKLEGRGLGLASVLGIVRGHRGAIGVSSEPGRGTTIRVLLPALGDPDASSR